MADRRQTLCSTANDERGIHHAAARYAFLLITARAAAMSGASRRAAPFRLSGRIFGFRSVEDRAVICPPPFRPAAIDPLFECRCYGCTPMATDAT